MTNQQKIEITTRIQNDLLKLLVEDHDPIAWMALTTIRLSIVLPESDFRDPVAKLLKEILLHTARGERTIVERGINSRFNAADFSDN